VISLVFILLKSYFCLEYIKEDCKFTSTN